MGDESREVLYSLVETSFVFGNRKNRVRFAAGLPAYMETWIVVSWCQELPGSDNALHQSETGKQLLFVCYQL